MTVHEITQATAALLLASAVALAPHAQAIPHEGNGIQAGDPNAAKFDGTDPKATGCEQGAQTLETKDIIDSSTQTKTGIVELRWSPNCNTNWLRVTSNVPGMVNETIRRTSGQGAYGQAHDNGPGVMYSPQVYAPTDICVQYDVNVNVTSVTPGKHGLLWNGTAAGERC